MMWPKLSECSRSDLNEMAKAIQLELDKRDDDRFRELAKAAADALNALKLEYPFVSLDICPICGDCGSDVDTNIFDCFDHISASDFRK